MELCCQFALLGIPLESFYGGVILTLHVPLLRIQGYISTLCMREYMLDQIGKTAENNPNLF